jgi:RND family efflux transporter MFP subunit
MKENRTDIIKKRGIKGFLNRLGKTKRRILIAGIILAVIIFVSFLLRPKPVEPNFFEAQVTDLSQEVSLTGKIKAAESVSLSFERSGRVSVVNKISGEKVYKGTVIASLDNSGLEANLAKAEAELGSILSGARPEEVDIQKAVVKNADVVFGIAKKDLDDKLSDNKGKIEEMIANKIDRFFLNPKTAPELVFQVNDYWLESKIESDRRTLETSLLTWESSVGADDESSYAIEVFADVRDISDSLLMAFGDNIISNYSQTTINGWKTDTETLRSFASTASSAIATAREKWVVANNSLAIAEKDLTLMLSGATVFQVDASKAAVEAVEAEIRKGMIISPINGVIGKIDITKGEMFTMGVEVASVISDKKFQIETYVPEVDVSKIKVGNPAEVTLDAYGSDIIFSASVISIDKGETVVDGVTAYKATIEFTDNDERIMSGMTANVDIKGESKSSVIAIPQRAVISADGKKFLDVLKDEETVRVEVKTGFKGSNGYVEITEGLSEGEKVLFLTSK